MASVHTSSAPLSAELVLGKTPSLKEPRLLGGVLYWLEQRPQEQGRTTLMARRSSDQDPQELTPGSWNLRCRVHEYGGGACAIGRLSSGEPVAVFVHDGDRCLWRLSLSGDAQPQRLTAPGSDGLVAERVCHSVPSASTQLPTKAVPLAGSVARPSVAR